MELNQYYVDFLGYNTSQYIKSNCADITFICTGNEGYITINGTVRLYGGQSLTLSANFNELDTTIYNVTVTSYTGDNFVSYAVLRKVYKKYEQLQKL